MFYQRKKVIMFFANVAFIFTSMLPNSVTMGMDNDSSTLASSVSSGLIDSDNESNNSSNIRDVSEVSEGHNINGSAQCCERCCCSFCNYFCDGFVQNHPCAAASCFLSLGIATVVLMAKVMSSNQ